MKRNLGTYSPEIRRDTIERYFDAVALYGFKEVQFDFQTACGAQMPEAISEATICRIRKAADAHGVRICAVNGTFNMIHPDRTVVDEGVRRFEEIARACKGLGCGIITLCTGTRNTSSMWRPHPDNASEQAWEDMLSTTRRLKKIAENYDVVLGIETEASNVVNTPERARKLLDVMNSNHFGIIFDPANLFHAGTARAENAVAVVEHAFELLKDDLVLAHAKDIHEGDGIAFTSAGRGIVPFERFFDLLDGIGYNGPVIAHGIHDEAEFAYSVSFLKSLM